MKPFQCRHIVVERCKSCQGIWFDKQELGVFGETLRNLPIETIKVNAPERSRETMLSSCPHCQLMLTESNFAYNSDVKIQTCHRCSGIWLRYTELIRYIDYVRTGKIIEPLVKGLLDVQRSEAPPNYLLIVEIAGGVIVILTLIVASLLK
jgi:Zn-finger nucleic acid-binding protein